MAKPDPANLAIRSKTFSRLRASMPAREGARDEAIALLRHLLGLLLAHRAAQEIRLAEGVAGELVRDLHHLLLVDDHAERLGDRSSSRSRYSTFVMPCLAVHVLVDHAGAERTRTVQRHQRTISSKVRGLSLIDQVCHAARLDLEHAFGVAVREQIEGRRRRAGASRRRSSACLAPNQLSASAITVSVLSPRKSNFDQADLLDAAHVELAS